MNKCSCTLDDCLCAFCDLKHQKEMQDEHDRQMAAYKASLLPCKFCGEDAEYGWCDKKECQDNCHNEHLISQVEDDKWRCEDPYDLEPGKLKCQHQWVLTFDYDLDIDANRVCRECGRHERQNLFAAPEPPNCYVPGYGWRVI